MAKKTTTTFKVTVEHSGNAKEFNKIMQTKGQTTITDVEVLGSTTKDLGVIYDGNSIDDESKIVRKLIKSACEEAGLKWKIAAREKGQYFIKYKYGGITVMIHKQTVKFENDQAWTKMDYIIYDRYSLSEDPDEIDKGKIIIADPNMFPQMIEIFREMNRGNDVGDRTNRTNRTN